MVPLHTVVDVQEKNWDFAIDLPRPDVKFNTNTVTGSQFLQPLFEFSGSCAGCGETPYVKLISQLFGDRMMIANATGCSSIYGGSAPTCPYTTNEKGHGPAWANSLFEDNAEFGYGMNLAVVQRRHALKENVKKVANCGGTTPELKAACEAWLAAADDAEGSKQTGAVLKAVMEKFVAEVETKECFCTLKNVLADADLLTKKSVWIFGGDGWAYDIGYGGLDHVLAMDEDVNVLVLDTEVYSNTGGQSSKATPTGSTAKFAAAGKRIKKKDLGAIAMTYGYVYVAQVCMGADQSQLLKALKEAEAYHGPSLVIAYAPCINHGINMSKAQNEQKRAVAAGYWQLYRFNPDAPEGTNRFTLDSKEPTADYIDFITSETRYKALSKLFPDVADGLFEQSKKDAQQRLDFYKGLAGK